MNNLDIIILSTVVITLFTVFAIATYREFLNADKTPIISEETGPRATMIKFIGKLFDAEVNKKMSIKQKKIMYAAVKRTIADMESDGVYFPEDIKIELENKRKDSICEYSGLPSTKTYDIDKIH